MFRLIAFALISTFLLLALFGTSSEPLSAQQPARAMGIMSALVTVPPPAEAPRRQYVSRHHQPLKAAPEPGARVLRVLPYGTEVELIDAGDGRFVQVRDITGDVGFIQASSLSDAFPG